VLQAVERGLNILSGVIVNLRTVWLKDIGMLDAEANNKYRFPRSVYSILSFHGGITEELLKAFKVYKVDNNLVGGEVQCYTTL
jgi:23S rRNA maturation-related 3'-5' exoribonuclease YhaM